MDAHRSPSDSWGMNTVNDDWRYSSARTGYAYSQIFSPPANPPKKKAFSTRCAEYLENSWFFEGLCWTLAACSFVAVIVLLRVYDNQILPRMPFGITLNALVTVLATISTTALMEPICQGISQLKWVWFARHKSKMTAFETFDEASRGPYGSVKLIFKMKGIHFSCLGAFISLVILASSSFTQQSIDYVQRLDTDRHESAHSPRAVSFEHVPTPSLVDTPALDLRSRTAFFNGLTPTHGSASPLQPGCSTGNCTWADYQTLGVCASVVNATSNIIGHCNGTDTEITCSGHIVGGKTWICSYYGGCTGLLLEPVNLTTSVGDQGNPNTFESQNFHNLQHSSIADFYAIWGTLQGIQALEINLHYCVQTLHTNVTNGNAHTNLKNAYTDFELRYDPSSPDNPLAKNYTAVFPDTGDQYVVGYKFTEAMRNFLYDQFEGIYVSSKAGDTGFKSLGMHAMYITLTDENAAYVTDPSSTRQLMKQVATSLTNHIRSSAAKDKDAIGKPKTIRTYVVISWPWLVPHAFAVGATLVFFLGVILINSRAGCWLWKESNLALLNAFVVCDRPAGFPGLQSLSEIQKHAETDDYFLRNKGVAWGLSASRFTT